MLSTIIIHHHNPGALPRSYTYTVSLVGPGRPILPGAVLPLDQWLLAPDREDVPAQAPKGLG